MWIGFIQMHIESNDVILTIFIGNELIHVFSPLLNIFCTHNITIVRTNIIIHLLVTESNLTHTVTTSSQDDIHSGSVVWLFPTFIRILYATSDQVLLHSLRDTLRLINRLYPATFSYLKVQMLSCSIITAFAECKVPTFLSPTALVFIALCRCKALSWATIKYLFCH